MSPVVFRELARALHGELVRDLSEADDSPSASVQDYRISMALPQHSWTHCPQPSHLS